MRIYYDPDFLRHCMTPDHPEQPERLNAIRQALNDHPTLTPAYVEPPLASWRHIERVHEMSYIDKLNKYAFTEQTVAWDADTLLNPYTVQAARRATGALLQAIDDLTDTSRETAFCLVRPPGHHAEPDRAMGFCFLNHVAIAACYALEVKAYQRVAIVDFDVHHGNGTESFVKTHNDVFFSSTFQSPLFPMTGRAIYDNNRVTIPLAPNSDGQLMRQHMVNDILPRLYAFQPELILVSAGFDAHTKDPLADLNWTQADYSWLGAQLKQVADQYCPGNVITTLEGGYHLASLASSAVAYLQALGSE